MTWLINIVIAIAAAGLGFSLGRSRRDHQAAGLSKMMSQSQLSLSSKSRDSQKPTKINMTEHMLSIFEEINYMQGSDDLFDRYQSFTALVENALSHAIGPCSVTLWSPDKNDENLIECVIRPVQSGRKLLNGRIDGATQKRQPCSVPLDSGNIRHSLQTHQPYMADFVDEMAQVSNASGASLSSDGCIPLFRKYGRPLLVNIQWAQSVKANTAWTHSQRQESFDRAVRLIKLFWGQLQVTNQREWMIEHDEPTGALRDDVFLKQGQDWVAKCTEQDEPFAIVVLTVRGFRSIFAGHSQQWKSLSGLIIRALHKVLTEKKREFLLGKVADDAYALLLPYTDEFLAGKVMGAVAGKLDEEITESSYDDSLDMMTADIHWTVGDRKLYKGEITDMLDKMYRRLFARGDNKHNKNVRVKLNRQNVEDVEHAGC